MKKTFKAFRNQLNEWQKEYSHKHYQFHQNTRSYGDYLYFQDREKFNVEFALWTPGETQASFESKV